MFKCAFCGHSFNVLQKYDLHQYFHRNHRKSKFICLHAECNMQFNSYSRFRSHLFRFHTTKPSMSLYYDNSNNWFQCSKERCLPPEEPVYLRSKPRKSVRAWKRIDKLKKL